MIFQMPAYLIAFFNCQYFKYNFLQGFLFSVKLQVLIVCRYSRSVENRNKIVLANGMPYLVYSRISQMHHGQQVVEF